MNGDIILYTAPDGVARVEMTFEDETFWLTQRRLAELFGVDVRTINYHLKEIFDSDELSPEATIRKIWIVQTEGERGVRAPAPGGSGGCRRAAMTSGLRPARFAEEVVEGFF